jgi:hypothetical protein
VEKRNFSVSYAIVLKCKSNCASECNCNGSKAVGMCVLKVLEKMLRKIFGRRKWQVR